MPFWLVLLLVALVAVAAGSIASVAGFGIGSLLTPLLAWQMGTKLAVAVVSIPHVAGTALRFWRLRQFIDRRVLWSFGVMSAAGGLAGALLHIILASPILTAILGGLLIFAGVMGLAGLAQKMRFSGWTAWVAGAASGLFGGLVGNQGGIRSAALLGFNLPRDAFVATATAIAPDGGRGADARLSGHSIQRHCASLAATGHGNGGSAGRNSGRRTHPAPGAGAGVPACGGRDHSGAGDSDVAAQRLKHARLRLRRPGGLFCGRRHAADSWFVPITAF